MAAAPLSLGVDTGGTFTDIVQIDAAGTVTVDKTFSTPASPEEGAIESLASLARNTQRPVRAVLRQTARLAHGTTVSTNALIQRSGAQVGLIATSGFEDTLVIGRGPVGRVGGLPHARAMDFLHTEPPPPLVSRRLVRGIAGRVTAAGELLAPVDPDQAGRAVQALVEAGAESLAVCLLWSFLRPDQEQAVRAAAGEVAPGLPVFLSSEIAPRMGEYERMVTTAVAAHVGPATTRYIARLQDRLARDGLRHPIQVMTASGGTALPDGAARAAVAVVNSGPVGGLVAARHLGRSLGIENAITADMGGTSFDVGVIAGGTIERTSTPYLGQGLPVLTRSVRIDTLGAGGGSIAVSDGFRLRVGPESAGADPGPAAYGRGGEYPTVTDALVVLGIVNPERFFAGRYPLDPGLAAAAIERHVARPMGLGVADAAAGIVEVVNGRMADLIRKVTIETGNDPRRFALIAYGGACGAHCADLAMRLGIARVVVPYGAAVFSALGIALSDIVYAHTLSAPVALEDEDAARRVARQAMAALDARAAADLSVSGFAPADAAIRYSVEMRYRGQMNEVSLDLPDGAAGPGLAERLRHAFQTLYAERYGASAVRAAAGLEVVSFGIEAMVAAEAPAPGEREGAAMGGNSVGRRRVHRRGAEPLDAGVHDFAALAAGAEIKGPAVIERDMTTIWVPPSATARLDRLGNVDIRPETEG
ncbi:MAG: hydantoinase/oxoprolinase family protein [Defluviicoccus sp.]|nr:hydantoinase/oxoprolinase family protein [Defluviicoccus sp.]MDE0385311.1 hydantoinase/oxoprolinase family protein [Defluviicoccus sp.]